MVVLLSPIASRPLGNRAGPSGGRSLRRIGRSITDALSDLRLAVVRRSPRLRRGRPGVTRAPRGSCAPSHLPYPLSVRLVLAACPSGSSRRLGHLLTLLI